MNAVEIQALYNDGTASASAEAARARHRARHAWEQHSHAVAAGDSSRALLWFTRAQKQRAKWVAALQKMKGPLSNG